MSDITLIDDSEQSSLVTNGIVKNGELYLKKAGSTSAGAIVVYDNGVWRTFANEAVSFSNDYSVELDGTNEGFFLPTNINAPSTGNRLGITGTSHTICFWTKFDTPSSVGQHLIFYNFSVGVRIRAASDGYNPSGFRFRTSGQSGNGLVVSSSTVADRWYFLAMVCDGTSHTFYVKSDSDDVSGSVTASSFTPIGYASANPPLNIHYDEFATFNSALSASDISNIYNSGAPGDLSGYASLAGHWRMGDSDGGTGATITDEQGGENIILVNGASVVSDVPS
jgi:hypothetical protein